MNQTEQILFAVALGAAAFILGVHHGAKKAIQQASQAQAADPGSAAMAWFTTWGK